VLARPDGRPAAAAAFVDRPDPTIQSVEQLTDKVAVVTGAGSGIGLALAARFAQEGMRVVLADIDEERLEAARAGLAAAGATVLAVPADVAQPAHVDALAAQAVAAYGAVHVVCNNAGVSGPAGPVWEISPDDWRWILDINLVGVINGIRAFVPHLIEQGQGHVVNTASVAGLATAMAGAYSVTKHAVVGLSEALHHQLTWIGSEVGVSVLCPGWVRTDILASRRFPRQPTAAEQAVQEATRQAIESGIDPAEVAGHVVAAIREERFYVITHPEMTEPAVRQRAKDILDGRPTPIPIDQ
jgi:NAD(P)-dependent dehydrogenase (short-subunit alcohol dehydrogenase family)